MRTKPEIEKMIKKYLVLIGMTISVILLLIAISIYSGGTYQDKNSVGFDWSKKLYQQLI